MAAAPVPCTSSSVPWKRFVSSSSDYVPKQQEPSLQPQQQQQQQQQQQPQDPELEEPYPPTFIVFSKNKKEQDEELDLLVDDDDMLDPTEPFVARPPPCPSTLIHKHMPVPMPMPPMHKHKHASAHSFHSCHYAPFSSSHGSQKDSLCLQREGGRRPSLFCPRSFTYPRDVSVSVSVSVPVSVVSQDQAAQQQQQQQQQLVDSQQESNGGGGNSISISSSDLAVQYMQAMRRLSRSIRQSEMTRSALRRAVPVRRQYSETWTDSDSFLLLSQLWMDSTTNAAAAAADHSPVHQERQWLYQRTIPLPQQQQQQQQQPHAAAQSQGTRHVAHV